MPLKIVLEMERNVITVIYSYSSFTVQVHCSELFHAAGVRRSMISMKSLPLFLTSHSMGDANTGKPC